MREADVRAMLSFVGECSALEDVGEFRTAILQGLRRLVPCEIASYNEIEFEVGSMIALADPPGSLLDGATEIFVRLGHQNPLIERFQRTRDGRPWKWSDLITRRELHGLELYREVYEPMGVEYQIAFGLPSPPHQVIGLALNRDVRDFSERDRKVLNLLRPSLIQMYRTVERYALVASRLTSLERGLGEAGGGVILLDQRGKVSYISPEAERALIRAFGASTEHGGSLPQRLEEWVQGTNLDREGFATPVEPLVVAASAGGHALVRFLPARNDREENALLIEQRDKSLAAETLRGMGLTNREAQVLSLVALGESNVDVARALGISLRTVHKHLENINDKLGTTSRTQAAATVWAVDTPEPLLRQVAP